MTEKFYNDKSGKTSSIFLSVKSQIIFQEHKIFIRVTMKIKSAIYIEFNILTTFMESRFISHLFPYNSTSCERRTQKTGEINCCE